MARKPRRALVPPPDVTNPRAVDGEIGPNDTNVHIDAKTGHVITENPDGSASVQPIRPPRKMRETNSFDDNLAEDMDESDLATITQRLLEGIEADITSRRAWEETGQKGADLIGTTLDEASAAIGSDGMIAKVKHTGLLGAVITSWANSRAELLPVGGPVKVRDDANTEDVLTDPMMGHNGGPPMTPPAPVVPPPAAAPGQGIAAPPGAPPPPPPLPQAGPAEKRNALADAMEKDFNHYLTVIDKDYYPDFSRMLISRALLGFQARKVYRDPILRRPVSRWVRGTDLIVSNEATSLASAARVTERIPMRQGMVKRLQKIKHWREVSLVIPNGQVDPMRRKIGEIEGVQTTQQLPADYLHTIYECYCDLDEGDLANDENGKDVGFPLPYRVTIDKDSRAILEIRRNWKKGDELYQKRRRYVKYGHVPGLGFYDWGYVHLIGNPQRAATMIERSLIDTGMLNSFPGGIMAKSPGTRQRTTEVRPGLGEFIVMDTGGLPIQDFVMPWPYKEPSAVLQAVGADVVAQMKQISGMVEMPVGEGMSNIPVGTIMAYVDAVTKVPSAVHKDDHIAQQEEFELLKELFEEDPTALSRYAKKPARKWQIAQEIADQDLVPAADPNVPSQIHRLMQTQMLVQNAGLPQFAGIANQRSIWERSIRTIGASNTGEYTMPQAAAAPPPPDPKIVAAQIKAKSEQDAIAAKAHDTAAKTAADLEKAKITSADKDADRVSEEKRAAMAEERSAIEAHADVAKHAITTAADGSQHAASLAHDHAHHTDDMHAQAAELVQDHVQHLNDLTNSAEDRVASTPSAADESGIAKPTEPPQ